HLSDTGISGATNFYGDCIAYEGLYGLKAETSDCIVTYSMYSHNKAYENGTITIQRYGNSSSLTSLGSVKTGETAIIDMKLAVKSMGLSNPVGVYVLSIVANDEPPIPLYLYYDGKAVQTCRYDSTSAYALEAWNRVVGNLDPRNCLDMYVGSKDVPITYPTSGTDGNCNHIQEWCDISDEIILRDNWSDEAKVFAFVLYLARNYAYDDWRVSANNNKSRATLAGRWDDDSLWTLDNRVGTCWDMANIMTIMCRYHGIPCTSVENEHHTVNAVWLRDEWVAIDVSSLLQHHCYTENTDPDGWINRRDGTWASDYGYYDYTMDSYNQALATPETTLSNKSGKNPI
ncbi:MAG: transglutaminase-like domain-containing protein, partial [Lachnospiraceae bacterium]|nr:transglutaminase-like domain-containing protein [Lachnospiraceae bacterium]